MNNLKIDPKLDLVLERVLDVSPPQVWEAYTKPEHLKEWFCPKPWRVVDCEIDVRPGGIFRTLMRGPNKGEEEAGAGCYLEVEKNRKLVWTSALEPGYRPVKNPPFSLTAITLLEPQGKGTKYTAITRHGDEETKAQHEKMGFHEGWGKALDQLVELMKARR